MWVLACPCLAHLTCTCACMCGFFTLPWWRSWHAVDGGLFNILIWHALTGNALSLLTVAAGGIGAWTHTPISQHSTVLCTISCTHASVGAVFFLSLFWGWCGQKGEQWESGLPSLGKQRHTKTGLYSQDHRLHQRAANIQRERLKNNGLTLSLRLW